MTGLVLSVTASHGICFNVESCVIRQSARATGQLYMKRQFSSKITAYIGLLNKQHVHSEAEMSCFDRF